jgi:transcriptional regulator with XRE-family HTH domain
MKFREKLAELRQQSGMSQPTFAEKIKMPLPTYRQYEQGQRTRIPFSAVVAIAKALGVDCRAFAECSDIVTADEAEEPAPAKPMGKRK